MNDKESNELFLALKTTYTLYVTAQKAGFTEPEAMQIVIALMTQTKPNNVTINENIKNLFPQ